jgi:hypothetical protein
MGKFVNRPLTLSPSLTSIECYNVAAATIASVPKCEGQSIPSTILPPVSSTTQNIALMEQRTRLKWSILEAKLHQLY